MEKKDYVGVLEVSSCISSMSLETVVWMKLVCSALLVSMLPITMVMMCYSLSVRAPEAVAIVAILKLGRCLYNAKYIQWSISIRNLLPLMWNLT